MQRQVAHRPARRLLVEGRLQPALLELHEQQSRVLVAASLPCAVVRHSAQALHPIADAQAGVPVEQG